MFSAIIARPSLTKLHPFLHDLEQLGEQFYETYDPTPIEQKYQMLLHKNIEEGANYRREQEHQWDFAFRRFNLLTEPLDDDRLSNVLIPIIKIVIMARVAQMTKGEFDVTYIPGHDDEDKIDLWRDCRRYVNNKANYRYELQRALLNMSLFGNGILYDGYRSAYQTVRIPKAQGFKETVIRDPRESKIFTQSIMPWNYVVSGGGNDHHDAPHHTYTAFMEYDDWVAEFARIPQSSGKPLYMHTKSVRPGKAHMYSADRDGRKSIRSFETGHKKVCVNYHWIPKMDLHMIESNGVLNWVGPNPYKHKRAPFSMLRLHPQMDANGGSFSVYGQGDAWLLSGLDTLYQNTMNMFTDNFYFANSSVIGVPQGVNLDIDDEEFYGGTVIHGADRMIVNQLGRVDGNAYNFMWKMLNDLIIWATGVPFNQLVPEGQITAYELSKRIEKASERQISILKTNESYGLKNSEEMKISNIFQFLPREEFYAVTDRASVDQLIEEKKIPENDVVYEDGIPVMIRTYPMVVTKGEVIEEKFVNNFPVAEEAKIVEKGKDGRLALRPQYVRPTDWLRNNGIPDVMIDSSTAFAIEDQTDVENTLKAGSIALTHNDRAKAQGKPEPFNEDEIMDDTLRVLKKNPQKWLRKNSDKGTRISGDTDTREVEAEMRQAMNEREMTTAPTANQAVVPNSFAGVLQGNKAVPGTIQNVQ